MILFAIVPESNHRRPLSVVATLVSLAQQMAMRSRPFTDEASKHTQCNVMYVRTRLHVGIIPNEQISRDPHQRLSELFFVKHGGHTEHLDWMSS